MIIFTVFAYFTLYHIIHFWYHNDNHNKKMIYDLWLATWKNPFDFLFNFVQHLINWKININFTLCRPTINEVNTWINVLYSLGSWLLALEYSILNIGYWILLWEFFSSSKLHFHKHKHEQPKQQWIWIKHIHMVKVDTKIILKYIKSLNRVCYLCVSWKERKF